MNDPTTQDGRTAQAMRQKVMDTSDGDLLAYRQAVIDALEGDSNDAEHDALADIAHWFDLDWRSPDE